VGGGEGERSLPQVPGRVEEGRWWKRKEVDLLGDNSYKCAVEHTAVDS